MALKVTEWIPILTPPVHAGEYDVLPKDVLMLKKAFKEEHIQRAVWCKRHGQYGFWTERLVIDADGLGNHKVLQMLDVLEWRGWERPRLTEEGICFLDALLRELGNVSAEIPRRVIVQKEQLQLC